MKNADSPILIVIGNYKNGGNAKQASVLANGFAELGKEVAIVVTQEISKTRFFELREGIKLFGTSNLEGIDISSKKYKWFQKKSKIKIKIEKTTANIYRKDTTKKKIINYRISKKRRNTNLAWIINSYHNPIIIVLGLGYAIDVYGVSTKKAKIFLATKTYAEGELKSIDRRLATYVLNDIRCTICQTQYTKEYFRSIGVKNLEVIHNPMTMEIPPFSGIRKKRIVNYCRISREKKLELLIEAFSVFHKEFPDYCVDIYGNIVNDREEAYKIELLELISAHNLSGAFRIHPAEKNIHEIVQDAAMFVSTSEFEGLSNSMIEAMALGIPCICTDCDGGGAREMIEDGVNGLLIPKNDVNALYDAMVRFADNLQFAEKCGKAAVKIRETTSLKNVMSQWNRVINKYC